MIPQGAAPFLWLLFYGSFLYVLFRKRYYRYAVPLVGTALVYLCVMAKGYASPAFVRATLPLFPIFAILLRPSGSTAAGSDDVERPSMVIEAESFLRGNARVDRTFYGQSIGVVATPVGVPDTFMEYEIELPAAGRYQVELRVASAVSRPLYLHVNGEVIGESIAAVATGGWLPESQRWIYAGTFRSADPRCTLRIRRDGGPIPHIDKLRLTAR